MEKYSFSFKDKYAVQKVRDSLENFFDHGKPVIVCIGTDLTIGDSLGPIIGMMLINKNVNAFVYGTLNCPVTAKDVKALSEFLKKAHNGERILVIDAAIGVSDDVGKIKVERAPIKPGSGANKDLPEVGDVNLIGIIAEKSSSNYAFLNLTRLSAVYNMASVIADGIAERLNDLKSKDKIAS